LSQVRIWIEHAIGGIKRYNILVDRFRNHRENFKTMSSSSVPASGISPLFIKTTLIYSSHGFTAYPRTDPANKPFTSAPCARI
jgi:hypothetical protein